MQDLKKFFKNIQFQNMFFNDITEFDGQDGLKEWVDNANMWLRKSYAKSEEECKQLFRNWIKNQIQKSSAKAIVMMDEMCVLAFCNREKFHQDPSNIVFDLSFLEEYENVKFVICVSPIFCNSSNDDCNIEIQNSFDLDFHNAPENSEKATYHHLSARYRNTAGILDFINFLAKNFNRLNYFSRFSELCKESDDSIGPGNLPLPFEFPNEPKWKNCKPVIWFKDLSNAEKVIYNLLAGKPVTFLDDVYTQSSQLKEAFELADKKDSEWEYHNCGEFNGSEADVIVYAALDDEDIYIYWPTMSRARKLLIIIANDSNTQIKDLKVLEGAVKKGLVTPL